METGRLPADGVRRMFDRIAPVYDAMNRVMTVGLDQRWRAATVRETVRPGDRVLDACCGTGDLAVAARARRCASVVGLDFSEAMLERARRKAPELEFIQGDVLALPFEDASFDAAVVGFGIRNVADLEAGLRELRRVLRPGGRLGILEITTPRGVLAPFYRLWFDPSSRSSAASCPAARRTRTCPRACAASPRRKSSPRCFAANGFARVRFRLFAGGIVALHVGEAAVTDDRLRTSARCRG